MPQFTGTSRLETNVTFNFSAKCYYCKAVSRFVDILPTDQNHVRTDQYQQTNTKQTNTMRGWWEDGRKS